MARKRFAAIALVGTVAEITAQAARQLQPQRFAGIPLDLRRVLSRKISIQEPLQGIRGKEWYQTTGTLSS